MADEVVKTTLLIDANKALAVIRQINDQMQTTRGAAAQLQKAVSDYSRTLGTSFEKTLADFKALNAQFLSVPQKFTAEGEPIEASRKDITKDVFQEAEALNKTAQAKNAYTTADSKATSANYNFDGSIRQVNKSLAEEALMQQRVAREMNALKTGGQTRTAQGTFGGSIPNFEAQFRSLSTYQSKLKLVQDTIENISKKTGAPIKDVGKELGKSFPTLLKDTNLVSVAVDNLAKKSANLSNSFKSVKQTATQVDLALTKLQKSGKLNFGRDAQQNINSLKDAFKNIKSTTGASFDQIASGMKRMGIESGYVSEALKGVNKEMLQGARGATGFRHNIDLVRTALGTLAAVGIFQILTVITEFFQKGIQSARQFELALYNVANAERILSKQGIGISPQDLRDIVDELQQLAPIFSRVDLTSAVSGIALFTKDLGYTKEQITDLSKAITVLAIRNRAMGLSFEQVQSQVLTGLLTGRAQGIRDLGVSVSESLIQTEALRLGLVKTSKEFDDLTGDVEAQIKAQALLSLVVRSTGDEMQTLDEYLETNDAKLEANKAAWEDLTASAGAFFTTIIPRFDELLGAVQKAVNGVKLLVPVFEAAIKFLFQGLPGKEGYKTFQETFDEIAKERIPQLFPEVPAGMSKMFQEMVGNYLPAAKDTATATLDLQDALNTIDTTKAQNELKDMLKDLEDLQDKMSEKEEDYQLDLARFDEDAARERLDIIEDYNLNVAQAIRKAKLSQKEANDKYRQKELEDERKFQEQMRQLQENFLYNLEDALRERDARQVLRLIDKYNMEKQALINENELRKKAAEENKQREDEERKSNLEETLRTLAEEHAIRLQRFDEESAIKRQRMEEDHAIEMERLRAQLDERIQEAANKIAEEYNVNAEGAQAIYDLLNEYYGTDGALAQLTASGYASMLGQANGFLSALTGVISQYSSMMSAAATIMPAQQSLYDAYNQPGDYEGYAKGGQFIATRPKKIMVGEGGEPELVTVTPLSQLGTGQNGISGANGLNGNNGQTQISVMVDLSPDLEARVIEKSLDGAAEVISQVRRSKA